MDINEYKDDKIKQLEAHSHIVQENVLKLTTEELLQITPAPKYSTEEYLIRIRKKSLSDSFTSD